MKDIFFKEDENFEAIIREVLKDKDVKNMEQISTGWTNIVYEVETNDGNYFFRFPRDNSSIFLVSSNFNLFTKSRRLL